MFKRSQQAFTFIEMVLALLILSASTLVAASMLVNGIRSYGLITERREALRAGRFALLYMRRQLEVISAPQSDITAISASSITFLPHGGAVPIRFRISGSQLLRDNEVLANALTNASAFSFYNVAGNSTNTPAEVAVVKVNLEIDTGVSDWGKVSLLDRIYLRNRYYTAFSD